MSSSMQNFMLIDATSTLLGRNYKFDRIWNIWGLHNRPFINPRQIWPGRMNLYYALPHHISQKSQHGQFLFISFLFMWLCVFVSCFFALL